MSLFFFFKKLFSQSAPLVADPRFVIKKMMKSAVASYEVKNQKLVMPVRHLAISHAAMPFVSIPTREFKVMCHDS